MLHSYGFKMVGTWPYDPYHVISNLRVPCNYPTYNHHSKPNLEKLEDHYECLETTCYVGRGRSYNGYFKHSNRFNLDGYYNFKIKKRWF